LSVKLELEQAIVLQALTEEQIQTDLNQFEADLAALKKAMEQDTNLQDLAGSPLMLSIMALAYRGLNPVNSHPRPLYRPAKLCYILLLPPLFGFETFPVAFSPAAI